jgi:hypothetical protein
MPQNGSILAAIGVQVYGEFVMYVVFCEPCDCAFFSDVVNSYNFISSHFRTYPFISGADGVRKHIKLFGFFTSHSMSDCRKFID